MKKIAGSFTKATTWYKTIGVVSYAIAAFFAIAALCLLFQDFSPEVRDKMDTLDKLRALGNFGGLLFIGYVMGECGSSWFKRD